MALSKPIAGALAAGLAGYAVNWCSLRGIDFHMLGVDSEIVKSTLVGTLSGFLISFTPDAFIQDIVDIIRWCKSSAKKIDDAVHEEEESK